MVEWLVAAAAAAGVGLVGFGLATGRLDRNAQGCCPADPAQDLRMRAVADDVPGPGAAAGATTPGPGPGQAAAGSVSRSAAAPGVEDRSVTAARTAPTAATAADPTSAAE